MSDSLTPDTLRKMDAYWRAANYLSVGQIYLQDNPLLERPLDLLYVHLNRLIKENDLNMIYVMGPGHGGPGIVAHSYLEGSYTEHYPAIERNRNGLQRLFRQFSWPQGIPSHVSPEVPGSIHEGGELGYSLAHAYGAAFDNPDLIVACVVGDGEAETGALAASWYSNAMGLQSGAFGFAGEESAGATFLRRDGSVWTTDKDGIATALLSAEITASTGRDPGRS